MSRILGVHTLLLYLTRMRPVSISVVSRAWRSCGCSIRHAGTSGSSHQWLSRQARDPYVAKSQAAGLRSRAAYKLIELQEKYQLIRKGDYVLDLGAAPGSWSQIAAELSGIGKSRSESGQGVPVATASGEAPLAAEPAARTSIFNLARSSPSARNASSKTAATTSVGPLPSPRSSSCNVVAIDLLPVDPLPGVEVLRGDFNMPSVQLAIGAALRGRKADVLLSDMAHNFIGDASLDHVRQMHLAWNALLFSRMHLRTGGNLVVKVRYGDEYKLFCEAMKSLFRRSVEVKPPASRADSSEAYLVGLGSLAGPSAAPTTQLSASGRALVGAVDLSWCSPRVAAVIREHGLAAP